MTVQCASYSLQESIKQRQTIMHTTISNTGTLPARILMHNAPRLEDTEAMAMHASPESHNNLQFSLHQPVVAG